MEIIKFEDNDDGSATITFDLKPEEVIAFAKIGLLDTLRETAQRVIDTVDDDYVPDNVEHYMSSSVIGETDDGYRDYPADDRDDIECRSRNPAKMCEGCTCWKNSNE